MLVANPALPYLTAEDGTSFQVLDGAGGYDAAATNAAFLAYTADPAGYAAGEIAAAQAALSDQIQIAFRARAGTLTAETAGTTSVMRWYNRTNGRITVSAVSVSLGTAAVGSAVTVAVRRNADSSNVVTVNVPAGSTGVAQAAAFTIDPDEYVRVWVTAVGSTTAGADLLVQAVGTSSARVDDGAVTAGSPGILSLADTTPVWSMVPANAQTGTAGTQETWQRGSTSGSESSDPAYAAGPPVSFRFTNTQWVDVLSTVPAVRPSYGSAADYTLMVAFRLDAAATSISRLLSARSVSQTGPGPMMSVTNTNGLSCQCSDGTNTAGAFIASTPVGVIAVAYMVVSGSSILARVNGATATGSRSALTSGQAPSPVGSTIARIGAVMSAAAQYLVNGNVYAAAAWDRALLTSEMDALDVIFAAGT